MSSQVAPWPNTPRRYTPEQRDAAFLVYVGAGKRSFRETARLTGINRDTLERWADDEDWASRLDGYGDATPQAIAVARALFPALLRAAGDRWLRILEDPKGNQNAQAKLIELAYGMYGMVAPKQSLAVVQHLTDTGRVTISARELASLPPEDRARFEASIGAGPEAPPLSLPGIYREASREEEGRVPSPITEPRVGEEDA